MAIPLRKLHYQALEKKISLLKEKCGNYEAKILSLNKHAIEDLKWWLGAIPDAKNNINTPEADFELTLMTVKLDGEPQMAPKLFVGFSRKMIGNTALTIWNY